MKVKILTIIFLLNFTSFLTLNAQWAKTYGTSEDEQAYFIKQTIDGGYLVAGTTGDNKFIDGQHVLPGQEVWIIKLSSDGNIEWQKIYGDYVTDVVHFIQQTNDGGYIIGGIIGARGALSQFSIIKLFPNGDIEWQKNYGEDDVDSTTSRPYSLQQTIDGGYIVAGHVYYSSTPTGDILILKLSFDGTVEWSKIYRGSIIAPTYSILQTDEGGYIVAGETNSFGAGGNDIWILKLTSDGTIEWQKTYGGSDDESANSIQKTKDGGYIVVGSSASFEAGIYDFWILKLSSFGDIEWNKIYGGNKNDQANSIQQTFDGGYVVAGETKSFGAGPSDFWILKLNTLGIIEWQKTYGGSQNEEASSVQQTIDGGYIVAGSTNSYGEGSRDFFILKLFPNGDINSSCKFINDSNADLFEPDIIPVDTYVDPEYPNILSMDIDVISRESQAVVYSLCSGPHTLSLTASSGGTTIPIPGIYMYDHAARIFLDTNPDEGYNFIGWTGDELSANKELFITMDSDKSIKANFSEDIIYDLIKEVKKAPCFIATAAFGSSLHPYVKTLQDFRDKYLMSSRAGRKFVNLYYKYSPYIAELITNHKALRTVCRIWLVPFVAVGYSMVHFGPVNTSFILILTIMPLFFFVWFYKRRGHKNQIK